MMKIYRTQDKQLTRVDEIGEGCWVCLNNPMKTRPGLWPPP